MRINFFDGIIDESISLPRRLEPMISREWATERKTSTMEAEIDVDWIDRE